MESQTPPQGPPNEAIFGALGRLIYSFNELEGALLNALITALGDSEEAKVVISGLSFNNAIDRFSVLYSALSDVKFEGGVQGLCKALSKVNEERNLHIHASWGFWDSGAPMRLRTRLRRNQGISLNMEGVDPEDVIALAKRMSGLAETVYALRVGYLEHRRLKRLRSLGS